MRIIRLGMLATILFAGCIGTDSFDDPKDSYVMLDTYDVSLKIGETKTMEATYYYNMWVSRPGEELFWQSNDKNVAAVTDKGVISGIGKGQAKVIAFKPGEDTSIVSVTVVGSPDEVARVVISSEKAVFNIGEKIQLSAKAFTIAGTELKHTMFKWQSSDLGIVTVDSAGLATAIANGEASVVATADGISSQAYKLVVGMQARTGSFQGAGSYNTSGTATLFVNESGDLILEFKDDFRTAFALGTFVYLANTTSGRQVGAQGFEIQEISGNGAHSFNVSNLNSEITLDKYQYVIILCKPASITFGSAELK